MNERMQVRRGLRFAITFSLVIATVAGALTAVPTEARADTTVNQSWSVPGTDKGFVLTVGDRSLFTPRLTAATLTMSIHDSTAIYSFSTNSPNCPPGTSPVLGVSAWSPGISVSTSVSVTISGTWTDTQGSSSSYSDSVGPVAVQPSLDSGLAVPAVGLCEVDSSEDPDPSPSPSPIAEPTPEPQVTPSPTVEPSPTATPTPEPEVSPTPVPTATPGDCVRGCGKPEPKKCSKRQEC